MSDLTHTDGIRYLPGGGTRRLKAKARLAEQDGGTIRYRGGRDRSRAQDRIAQHERVRPGWHWRAVERVRDQIKASGREAPPNPYPAPTGNEWRPSHGPNREILAGQIADRDGRRKSGALWPAMGRKELEKRA